MYLDDERGLALTASHPTPISPAGCRRRAGERGHLTLRWGRWWAGIGGSKIRRVRLEGSAPEMDGSRPRGRGSTSVDDCGGVQLAQAYEPGGLDDHARRIAATPTVCGGRVSGAAQQLNRACNSPIVASTGPWRKRRFEACCSNRGLSMSESLSVGQVKHASAERKRRDELG